MVIICDGGLIAKAYLTNPTFRLYILKKAMGLYLLNVPFRWVYYRGGEGRLFSQGNSAFKKIFGFLFIYAGYFDQI